MSYSTQLLFSFIGMRQITQYIFTYDKPLTGFPNVLLNTVQNTLLDF